jgi:hypothetical protein
VAGGKEKKVALVAAMRKLLLLLNTMIRNDQLWKILEMERSDAF